MTTWPHQCKLRSAQARYDSRHKYLRTQGQVFLLSTRHTWPMRVLISQAAALGSLAEKLAPHLEALWPVCDVVAALDGNQGHLQPAQPRGGKLGKCPSAGMAGSGACRVLLNLLDMHDCLSQ